MVILTSSSLQFFAVGVLLLLMTLPSDLNALTTIPTTNNNNMQIVATTRANVATINNNIKMMSGVVGTQEELVVSNENDSLCTVKERKEEQKQRHNRRHTTTTDDDKESYRLWEIRLYNDNTNYREYVAEMLCRYGDLTPIIAYRCMKHADENGQSVLGVYEIELAEHYTVALQSKGLHVDKIPLLL